SLGPLRLGVNQQAQAQIELSYFELGLQDRHGPRFKRFISAWLRQVLANACERPVCTLFIGPDGVARFEALPPPLAQAVLTHLLVLYQRSMRTMPYCAAEPGLLLAQESSDAMRKKAR